MTAMTTTRLLNAGRKLHARVRDFFDATPDATAPPLELLQAALDQLERKVQSSGRGTRTFPYNRVIIHIAQPDADRAAIEAVFTDLPARLRERLTELRCDLPAAFEARAAYEESVPENGAVLWIECSSATTDPAAATATVVAAARAAGSTGSARAMVAAGNSAAASAPQAAAGAA